MLFRLFILLTSIGFATIAYAGAWLQPKDQGLAITSATYYGTSRYFDDAGQLQSQSAYSKYELQQYVEYGARKNLTLGGSFAFQRVIQFGQSNHGIADPEIFARTKLWQGERQLLSIQPLLKLKSQFARAHAPRGGSGTTEAELAMLYGRNFHLISDDDYVDTKMAYRWRGNGLHSQWRVETSVGLNVTDKLQLVPAMRSVATPLMDETNTYTESGDSDYDMLKLELGAIYHLTPQQWVEANVFKPVAGIQTGGGTGISLAFAQQF